ncbi:hypothetical protein [Hydrogeniiclostridium mannosilyticum]|uniref:hypothetical protein n=1 Tax=Hydrogeniiclostridium mannosilyticum TaxID=2764322 RepID=UPI00399C0DB7
MIKLLPYECATKAGTLILSIFPAWFKTKAGRCKKILFNKIKIDKAFYKQGDEWPARGFQPV